MFSFLKDKLKGALSLFSKKVDEAGEEGEVLVEEKKLLDKEVQKKEEKKQVKKQKKREEKPAKKEVTSTVAKKKIDREIGREIVSEEKMLVEEKVQEVRVLKEEVPAEPLPEEKGFFAKLKGRFVSDKTVENKEEGVPAQAVLSVEGKSGFFTGLKEKITTRKISGGQFDELFWELELALLENNVAVEVIEKIKADLKSSLVDTPLLRSRVEEVITSALRESVKSLFERPAFDFFEKVRAHKPCVVCLVGVNGSGKTTTIAKLARVLQDNGLSCVIAAADTFRAAAIDQLQIHADNLRVKLIKQGYGSDAAAVAFDAVKHAQAKNKDVVLIDTAGRLHSNVNLMDEMKKIIRVAKPHLKLFIGESITGNDCVEQAKLFDGAIGIDGIILAKADIDEKGGAALSVSYVTKKPILYLGTGQEYSDLEVFDKEKIMNRLGL